MLNLEIGGARYRLDPAAISAVRYRAEHGASVITHLAACETGQDLEQVLLRMCHMMIPEGERPELKELARRARRDPQFFQKALAARDALLSPDPTRKGGGDEGGETFDEYQVLALMAVAGVDMTLLYELPILHLLGVVGRCVEARDPERKNYRPLNSGEMAKLYPR